MGAGRRVKPQIILACICVSGLGARAMAQTNLSFEKPTTGGFIDDGNALINNPSNAGFWGWGYFFGQTGTADKDAGVQVNTNAQLSGNAPDGTPQDGWVNGGSDYLYQDVGALAPNTTYSLTVAIAAPGGTAYGGVGSGNNAPTEIIELLNGNNVPTGTVDNVAATGTVLSASSTITPAAGTFADYNIGYATGASVSGDLTILLENTSSGAHEQAIFDDVRITGIAVPVPQWSTNGSGDWNVAGNWSTATVPNGIGAVADFFGTITANHTVYTDAADTVGTINFNNPFEYEITGTGSLTLQTSTGNAQVIVQQGSQEINLPTTVASNTTFNVASGSTLTIGNPLTIDSGMSLTQTGSGTVTYNSIINVLSGAAIAFQDSTHANTLSVAATGTASITSPNGGVVVEVNNLSNAGKVNVANNELLINYGSGADPIATIASQVAGGYNGGAWNGVGIDSTSAAVHAGYGLGYADSADPGNPANLSSGTIEVKYTLLGDANLDGVVNGVDFGILAANFNKGISAWDGGDFFYHGVVNGVDFGALAANFNKGASGAAIGSPAYDDPAILAFASANGLLADVPEPASVGLLTLGAIGLLSGRRRRSI